MTAKTLEIDPITFEVVRNKLQAITEEQAITLKSVSGSPVVTEATDFNNGLYLTDGSIVTMGPQVIFHTGTMSSVIRSIIANFSENPGIKEGDMFILNDPYRGAIHQPDVSIVAPIFHRGKHVAWAGSCAHQLDVGGMSFGSWAIGATEIQQEAMLLPGIKLVEGGVLRQDLWQMIMGMTRLPQVLGLDLKAMIAANNVAARQFHELLDRYGARRCRDDHERGDQRHRAPTTPDSGETPGRRFSRSRLHRARWPRKSALSRVRHSDEVGRQSYSRYDRHVAAGAGIYQLHCVRHARRRSNRTVADSGADDPLERRRHAGGDDRCARGDTLQRNVAGAGLLRDDFDSVDRSECRRRSSLTLGRIFRRICQRRACRNQGPHDRDDSRRGGSRRRPIRNLPPRFNRRRWRRLHRSRWARRLGRLLRATACDCECRSERGQWTVPVSLSWVRPRYRRTRSDARRSRHFSWQ